MNQPNLDSKKLNELLNQSLEAFIAYGDLKTHQRKPIEFNQHNFLRRFADDKSKNIVIQKGNQVGVSLIALLKVFQSLILSSITAIWTEPTDTEAKKFTSERIDPIIENSEFLSSLIGSSNSRMLKKFGDSFLHIRGTWKETQAISIPADWLLFDELDFSKPDIRDTYHERLSGSSSLKKEMAISIPSLSRFGIADLFEKSDQMTWRVICPSCKKSQELSFENNIDRKAKRFVCRFCGTDIEDERINGFWQARNPGKKIRGYWMPQLIAPWIPCKLILDKEAKAKSKKKFFNNVLGLPRKSENKPISKVNLPTFCSQDPIPDHGTNTIMGVDVGTPLHVIIGQAVLGKDNLIKKKKVLLVDKFPNFDKLYGLMKTFDVRFCVIDGQPDGRAALKFAKTFKKKVFLAFYVQHPPSADYEPVEWEKDSFKVLLSRTDTLDDLYYEIQENKFEFPKAGSETTELFQHLDNLIVEEIENSKGIKSRFWKKVGLDDFAHALNYFNVAMDANPKIGAKEKFHPRFSPSFVKMQATNIASKTYL